MGKSSKRRREEPRDRLSELPDSIIFEIFGLLLMRDVVRTTVLSKRWENLWTTTPYLNFDNHTSEFVNRVLTLWNGVRILKLKLGHGRFNRSDIDLWDSWVHLAKENGVQELYLRKFGNEYCVPSNLYSCSSLKVLSLIGCDLEVDGNVQWNQLRSLTIESFSLFIDEHSVNQLVSGCPQLEVFVLKLWETRANLNIQSSSLKRLKINQVFSHMNKSRSTELRIWSPNLETLDFVGVPFDKYSLVNVSSLTHLALDFFYYQIYGYDLLGEILGQIIPTLQHVEKLTLSDWCIKAIGAMKDKCLLTPLSSNLKFLTINKFDYREYEQMVGFLQISPKLETLVIGPGRSSLIKYPYCARGYVYDESNLPESFLLQLKTVEISFNGNGDVDLVFRLIMILLKHASKLQKMVVRVEAVKERRPSMSLYSILQKLLRMPKSSPTAELSVVGDPDY